MDPFGPMLTYLDLFGQSWCHLEQFRALWTNLNAIGPIESVIFICPERLLDFLITRGRMIFAMAKIRRIGHDHQLPSFSLVVVVVVLGFQA